MIRIDFFGIFVLEYVPNFNMNSLESINDNFSNRRLAYRVRQKYVKFRKFVFEFLRTTFYYFNLYTFKHNF